MGGGDDAGSRGIVRERSRECRGDTRTTTEREGVAGRGVGHRRGEERIDRLVRRGCKAAENRAD